MVFSRLIQQVFQVSRDGWRNALYLLPLALIVTAIIILAIIGIGQVGEPSGAFSANKILWLKKIGLVFLISYAVAIFFQQADRLIYGQKHSILPSPVKQLILFIYLLFISIGLFIFAWALISGLAPKLEKVLPTIFFRSVFEQEAFPFAWNDWQFSLFSSIQWLLAILFIGATLPIFARLPFLPVMSTIDKKSVSDSLVTLFQVTKGRWLMLILLEAAFVGVVFLVALLFKNIFGEEWMNIFNEWPSSLNGDLLLFWVVAGVILFSISVILVGLIRIWFGVDDDETLDQHFSLGQSVDRAPAGAMPLPQADLSSHGDTPPLGQRPAPANPKPSDDEDTGAAPPVFKPF